MEGGIGFFIIAIVGLTSLILPLASVVILVNLLQKIEGLEKKVDQLTGSHLKAVESSAPILSNN